MGSTVLANRIDQGYGVEVRAGELLPPEDGDIPPEERQLVEDIRGMQKQLSSMNLTGQPVLQLPERSDDDEADSPDSEAPAA